MIFCAKHKINLFRTDGRFLLCKKSATFAAANNFIVMRMKTQKRKTLPLHSARLRIASIGVLTNIPLLSLWAFVYKYIHLCTLW